MLDCDWCPVCSRAIPPESVTITLNNDNDDPPVENTPAPPVKTTHRNPNGKPNTTRTALHRAQPPKAAARRAAIKAHQRDKEITAVAAVVDQVTTPSSAPAKQRTVISQEPSPLYCSQKCRLEDEAKSNALRGWDWHPYDDHVGFPHSVDTEHSNPPTLTTASTDSVPSLASPTATTADHQIHPSHLRMSTMPLSPPPQQQMPLQPGSAPATVHAPIAPHSPPLHYGGVSTLDLYAVGYPLAFNPGQQRASHAGPHERLNPLHHHHHHHSERSSSASAQKRNRLRHEGSNWDLTPTQSLLIPSAPASIRSGGYDDLERRRRIHRSGSSSSSRSRMSKSRNQPRHQSTDSDDEHSHSNHDDTDDDSHHPTGLIMRSSVPVSVPGSLGSNRRSQSNHSKILSSSPLRISSSVSSKRQSIGCGSKLGTHSHIPESEVHTASASAAIAKSRSTLSGTSRSISNAEANGWGRSATTLGPQPAPSKAPSLSISPRDLPSTAAVKSNGLARSLNSPQDIEHSEIKSHEHRRRRSRANLSFTTMDSDSKIHPSDSTSSSYSAMGSLSHAAQSISTSSSTATIAALPQHPSSKTDSKNQSRTQSPTDSGVNGNTSVSAHSPETPKNPKDNSGNQQTKRAGSFAALASFFGLGGFGGLLMTSSNAPSGDTSPASAASGDETKKKSSKSNVGNLVRPRSSSNASIAKLDVNGEINVPRNVTSPLGPRTGDSNNGDAGEQANGSRPQSRQAQKSDSIPEDRLVDPARPFDTLDDMHMPRAKKPLKPLTVPGPVTGTEIQKQKSPSPPRGSESTSRPKSTSSRRHRRTDTEDSHGQSRSKSPSRTAVESTGRRSAWDPELVEGLKASRRMSEMSTKSGNGAYPNPFHSSPPLPSPTLTAASSTSHYSHRSHPHSHSHSRVSSVAPPDTPGLVSLPRSKSNHSITSMTSSNAGRQTRHSLYGPAVAPHAKEPPSPGAAPRSKPAGGTHLPRGLSMTSLSAAGYPHTSNRGGMYGPLGPPTTHASTSNTSGNLVRTTSQPYVNRWFSTSPSAGGSAFGSPSVGGGVGGTYSGYYNQYNTPEPPVLCANQDGVRPPVVNGFSVPPSVATARKKEEMKAMMPTYPLLNLPTGTRKKMVSILYSFTYKISMLT
ncbi:hypothetical protein FRC02_011129 [Tulasnella sp. 418]|nr:hypothetical protein FRC02_011129 [Tulasnella sp. 418]